MPMLRQAAVVCSLLFAGGLIAELSAGTEQVEIVAKTAKVKVKDKTIAVVKQGEKYRVHKYQGAWVAVYVGKDDKAERGWILLSEVRTVPDPNLTEESEAPPEPVQIRLTVDLTQFPSAFGPQATVFFKIGINNEGSEPIDLKTADIQLKVDDQLLPLNVANAGNIAGYPLFADSSMQSQIQAPQLPYLKDAQLAAGSTAEGWLSYSLNVGNLPQLAQQPGEFAKKSWILTGKVGPHPIHYDLKEAELKFIADKLRPSKLDPSVQVLEIGERVNAFNSGRIFELLRSVPAAEKGCVIVLKQQQCLFDGMAFNHFQQQIYQITNQGMQPVVSDEGKQSQNRGYVYQNFFSMGQIPRFASETAGVINVLGRRPQTGKILVKHLDAEESDTRAAAAQALAQHLTEAEVLPALTKAVGDSDPNVRTAAVGSLGGQPPLAGSRQNGTADTVALIKAMEDPVSSVKATAARTGAVYNCSDVRTALVKLLDDADYNAKMAAISSVGTLAERTAIPKLKRLQADQNQQIKTAAIDARMSIGDLSRLDGALAKLDGGYLQDPDYAEIGKARDKRAVGPLIARLKGNDNFQANMAARTLGDIGDVQAVDPLIQAVVFGNRNYGMAEMPRALGKLGDAKAIEPLQKQLAVNPNQFMPFDLKAGIVDALLMLKAPAALEIAAKELKAIADSGQAYQIGPALQTLGRMRDPKAIPILESFLNNAQTCVGATDGLLANGSVAARELVEKRLSEPGYQYSQMAIQNRRWPRTTTSAKVLKKIAAGENQFGRTMAQQMLNNLRYQWTPGVNSPLATPIGCVAPAVTAPQIPSDAWINGAGPTADALQGKVVLVIIPDTADSLPTLPDDVKSWVGEYESRDLVVLALWKGAGWVWDGEVKDLVRKTGATPQAEREGLAELVKARGIKYPIALLPAADKLTDRFGGPGGTRVAIIDRAGVIQAVRSFEDLEFGGTEFKPLIAELVADAAPSKATVRIPWQLPRRPQPQPATPLDELPEFVSSFDPAGARWTIPAQQATIWTVRFSPNGKTVASGGDDGVVRVWDLENGKLRATLAGHNGNIRNCIYSNDGKKIITAGFDSTLRIWDAEKGESIKTLTDVAANYFLNMLADDRTLVAGSGDSRVRVWDLERGEIVKYLEGHTAQGWATAAATVDGKSTIASGGPDKTVRIWDYPSGEARHTLNGHEGGINAVAVTKDAKLVASAGGEVILWNAATGEKVRTIPSTGPFCYDVAFSPDQKQIAIARSDRTVALYEVDSGNFIRQWNGGGYCVHFSADGSRIASGGDDQVLRIWKVAPAAKKPE